jgi:hypothetical protein
VGLTLEAGSKVESLVEDTRQANDVFGVKRLADRYGGDRIQANQRCWSRAKEHVQPAGD